MADQRNGGIGWTDETINPIRRVGGGHHCVKISPACKYCYSSRMQPRFGAPRFGETRAIASVYLESKVLLRDRKGADMTEFPTDLRVRQFPGHEAKRRDSEYERGYSNEEDEPRRDPEGDKRDSDDEEGPWPD